MEFLCIIISVVLAAVFLKLTRHIYNAGTIFFVYWAVVIMFTSLDLDNATPVRQSTYSYILLGLGSFAAGCLVCLLIKHRIQGNPGFDFKITSYRLLNIVCVIIIAYSLYRCTIVIDLLLQGLSWGDIRLTQGVAGATGAGTLKGGEWSLFIHDYCVAPCVYLIAPTAVVDFMVGNRNKRFISMSLIAILLYSFATVSRAIWVFLILYLLFVLLIFLRQRYVIRNLRRLLKGTAIFLVFLVGIVLGITVMRSETSQVDLSYNIIAYLTGGVRLFDIHLQEPIANIRTYGSFSLYGFVYPVFFVLNFLGIMKYPAVFTDVSTVKQHLEEFVTISDHIRINSYSTMFFNFYIDFGVIGILIGSFVFGFFCMLAYMFVTRKKDVRSLVLYLILVQFMLFSVARIYTIYTTRALSLIWLFIILPKAGDQDMLTILKNKLLLRKNKKPI